MQELTFKKVFKNAENRNRCIKSLFMHDISNLFHILSNSFELCEILLRESIKVEEILGYFKLIEEQINRGKKLVRNIQKYSELEESLMKVEPVDIIETLREAIQFINTSFPKRVISIKISNDYRAIYAAANEMLLDVFENILMNAVVYNRNEIINIDILVSKINAGKRQFIKLEFKDNGIGIDNKRKKEILQENHKKSDNSKGMGVGLSMVAKFIDLYEGKMWIEDRVAGDSSKGSNFILLIPRIAEMRVSLFAYQQV